MSIRWLRKYDAKAQKWTNQCIAFNPELAKEPHYKEVDEDEAAKCAIALAAEKRAACISKRLSIATEHTIKPALNKITDKQPDEEAPLTLEEIEKEAAKVDVVAEPEPVTATETIEVPKVDDGLDGLDKPALIAIIDAENLSVKKTYNADNMRTLIRQARKG